MMLVYLGTLQGKLGTLKEALAQLPNKKDPLYVSQNPEMKCRHPERDSGTALLKKKSVFISIFISAFLMLDGSENRIPKFKVLYATS